ncbi:hypothetical protein [Streptomyces sp. AC495_CC817]|uniref:hypothetical protein n=1 Tax=Streptomyces sp. AC495_CC817 TaxID=2823900 RepID=UPI001C2530EB|nr:hypothetical protein [Streptomyces sp. AC495_CC817]
MTLYATPEEHAANPPETWTVRKLYERRWVLVIDPTQPVDYQGSYETKRRAEAERDDPQSWTRRLYDDETRWYAGEQVRGWKPWAEVEARRDRIRERFA